MWGGPPSSVRSLAERNNTRASDVHVSSPYGRKVLASPSSASSDARDADLRLDELLEVRLELLPP